MTKEATNIVENIVAEIRTAIEVEFDHEASRVATELRLKFQEKYRSALTQALGNTSFRLQQALNSPKIELVVVFEPKEPA